MLALYLSTRNIFILSLFSSVGSKGRTGGSGGSSRTWQPQSAVSPLKFVRLMHGWSMAVSALDPWTPDTQPKLLLLGTLGNSSLMIPRFVTLPRIRLPVSSVFHLKVSESLTEITICVVSWAIAPGSVLNVHSPAVVALPGGGPRPGRVPLWLPDHNPLAVAAS